MTAPWETASAERQSRSRGPAGSQIDDSIAASDDLLFDFFDFFDTSIDEVYAYVLHRTRVPELAEDITLNVYFSLLQRRRFFWWRNIADISTLLPIADKAIAAMPRWEEDTTGHVYLDVLKKHIPDGIEEAAIHKLQLLLRSIKSLPIAEQKIAVMCIFLHWPAEKAARILEKSKQNIEKAYEAVTHQLIGILGKEIAFQESSVEKFFESIHCPIMEKSQKAALRVAILEKYRSAQMSNVRFVVPAIAMMLFFTLSGYTAYSTYMLPSVSAFESKRQIAAARVLLLDRELHYRDVLSQTEADIQGLAAYFAEKDLARINVDLAPSALAQQVKLEQEVGFVLRRMGEKIFISLNTFTWPRAFAEDQ
jgi:DNA-directed RNA polymerase specialized sigma24 family protein